MERRSKWVQRLQVQIGNFELERDSGLKWENHQQHFGSDFPELGFFQHCLGYLGVMVVCMEEEMEWVMEYES
jgi:hypothetical protein